MLSYNYVCSMLSKDNFICHLQTDELIHGYTESYDLLVLFGDFGFYSVSLPFSEKQASFENNCKVLMDLRLTQSN